MQYNQGYIAGIYEVDKTSGGSVTRTVTYYPAGAMRINGTLYYMVSTSSTRRLKDHLGSASVVTDASGTIVGEDRSYPYGETRFTTGTMYTDKLYTGQREMTGLGIYHYEARFYSQKLGRFLGPDSLVPDQFNPQYLNRFSYVRNNPIRYTDPTGHMDAPDVGGGCYQCRRPRQPLPPEPPKETVPPDEEPDPIIDIPILGGPIISPGTAPDFDKPLCEMLKKRDGATRKRIGVYNGANIITHETTGKNNRSETAECAGKTNSRFRP